MSDNAPVFEQFRAVMCSLMIYASVATALGGMMAFVDSCKTGLSLKRLPF